MKPYLRCFSFFLIGLTELICSRRVMAQSSYGLGFYSHEVISDQRTTLDLFPRSAYAPGGSFRLAFDLSFLPDKIDYFGYIFRIIENDRRNIDLVYNNRDVTTASERSRFKLVIGDRYSNITFNIPAGHLFDHWNKITLDFDYGHDELILGVNGTEFKQKEIHFNKDDFYRVVFGLSKEPNFKASDCSAFKIRDIRISETKSSKYWWPLNEATGNQASEQISGKTAIVYNPSWIKAQHANWEHVQTLHVKGISSMGFNAKDDILYVTGTDSLWQVSAKNFSKTAVGYHDQQFSLLPSNETIYNPYNGRLYNYFVDNLNKRLSVYDFAARKWTSNVTFLPAIDYWQSNSFFSQADSSLYVVGGYGRMTYKNNVHRYHLKTAEWEDVTVHGDYYCPRYLAACGTVRDGQIAYFLGGYGSKTGEQMLNAKNLYDLLKFDVKTKSFKKIYELKVEGDGFVFANSMVIDEKKQTFSALVFSNQKFNSQLRLLTGSLSKPNYQLVGNSIPFKFHDTHSTVKLFYSDAARQLIAVAMNRPLDHDKESNYEIYRLWSPPENLTINVAATHPMRYVYYLVSLFGLSFILISIFKIRKKKKSILTDAPRSEDVLKPGHAGAAGQHLATGDEPADGHAKIFLFGDLKVYDKNGTDLTGHFTSLVKELFLVVLYYSLKSARGISPEKLIELLWPDKSEESARNNRSANLSKLKSILGQLDHIQLSKNTGNWRTEINYDFIDVDYWQYLQILSSKKPLSKTQIVQLCALTQRGSFLASSDYHWLDQIKADIANEAIDIYLHYITRLKPEQEPEFAIELANAIFIFDPVNEEAMTIKCRALSILGKHSLAKLTFESFNKEFSALYGEEFKSDFHKIVGV